jgi:tetratricopeptide (TPR) repeat protein
MSQSPIWEPWESWSPDAANAPYNRLVQGFRAGQLSLKIDVPPGLTALPDPYDPTANDLYRETPYKFHDLTYYKGRFYLYFGVAPAVLLLWPFAALTGHYLLHREAVLIFCMIGFLASVWLLRALWRRYFAEVSVGVVVACVLALGLASGTPALLSWAGVYEVPISCGYMLTMLALGGIWCALHEPERGWRWLAAASAAYGLAVASRPNLVFGGIILLVPVVQAWREGKRVVVPLMAGLGPILLIGLGLIFYNFLRFDNPLEFGMHYALTGRELGSWRLFGLQYLWFNFRIYFLEPARWGVSFPFLHHIAVPPRPAGYWEVANPFGVLTTIPLVWLALAAPLAWRNRLGQADSGLRWFVSAVALLFGVCALTLCLFLSAAFRYEVDFLPTLMVLAVVGILGCERVLVDRPAWRRGARLGWGLLLGFSVAFNLLVTLEYYSYTQNDLGGELSEAGKPAEAAAHFERAVRLKPDYAEAHYSYGAVLQQLGKVPEAVGQYEQALRTKPDYAEAHNNLGIVLLQEGKVSDAIGHYEQALRSKPDYAEAHNNLGVALGRAGRIEEAIAHYEQALRLKPDYAEAHYNLGIALGQAGRIPEATEHFEQAIRIKPGYAEAHANLGNVLLQEGKLSDAIAHYEQALRSKPDLAEAHANLGVALGRAGRIEEAIGHYEQALRLKPDYAEAHYNLGIALAQMGKIGEAIAHYEQALRIKPDDAEAHFNLALALEKLGRTPEAIEHYQQALKLRADFPPARNALERLQAGR